MLIIYIPLMIYLIGQELYEYWRLPDKPALMTTAAAIQLAGEGARPLVQLTDAQWDCDHLSVRDRRTDITTIELLTPVTNSLIIVKFWGKHRCNFFTNKVITGVLRPTGKQSSRQFIDDRTAPYTDDRKTYELCGYCSR